MRQGPDSVRLKSTKILISSPNTIKLPFIRIVFSRRFLWVVTRYCLGKYKEIMYKIVLCTHAYLEQCEHIIFTHFTKCLFNQITDICLIRVCTVCLCEVLGLLSLRLAAYHVKECPYLHDNYLTIIDLHLQGRWIFNINICEVTRVILFICRIKL